MDPEFYIDTQKSYINDMKVQSYISCVKQIACLYFTYAESHVYDVNIEAKQKTGKMRTNRKRGGDKGH